MNNSPTKHLLTIDGGGLRGLIPAMALAKLEHDLHKPANQIFDFVAGTSTGAIIAASVAAGIPADQIVALYLNRGRDIFAAIPFWSTVQRVFLGSMYSTTRLNRVIQEALADRCTWRLNDATIDLLITAKGVPGGKPWYFVRDNPGNAQTTGNLPLVDCATASAAAPTFFQPWRMPGPDGTPLVDGGVGVTGNPIYQACVEAFQYTRDLDGTPRYLPAQTVIISLGTGFYTPTQQPTWIWPWLNWLITEMMGSPAEQQTELVQRHYPDAALYRLDVEFEENIPLDSLQHLPTIQQYGQRLSEQIEWQAMLSAAATRFRVDTHPKAQRAAYRYKPTAANKR